MLLAAALRGVGLCLVSMVGAIAAVPNNAPSHAPVVIAMPGGKGGIGFDDLACSRILGKVLVPSGQTGKLNLVDPGTRKIVSISGFGTKGDFHGGHGEGITSVAEGAGLLFVTDRTSLQLSIVDPATMSVVGRSPLSASPDYVRWLEPAHEMWVTEPDSERFEVFKLENGTPPRATVVTTISVPGGPESLVFDLKRGRAYTHLSSGKTVAIDLGTRTIVATWSNECTEAKGIALDPERGFLFIACEEGRAVVLDVTNGKELGRIDLGGGIDIIAYNRDLGHLYVPSGETATVAIMGVSPLGALAQLGTFPTANDSHCVTSDANGKIYVGDPDHGRLLVFTDPYPPSPR